MKILFAVLLAAAATTAGAATYDPFTGFSGTANPNGVYTYGYENNLGGALTPYTVSGAVNGAAASWRSSFDPYLGVYLLPTTLLEHPGPSGQYSVIRITLPTAGSYKVSGVFANGDNASTDVHVLADGQFTFSAPIAAKFGGATTAPFSFTQHFNAGSTVDFAVGYGGDGNYYNDSTLLSATVTSVPEPASWALLVGGFGLVGLAARRRTLRTA